jgi:hypothetical protein
MTVETTERWATTGCPSSLVAGWVSFLAWVGWVWRRGNRARQWARLMTPQAAPNPTRAAADDPPPLHSRQTSEEVAAEPAGGRPGSWEDAPGESAEPSSDSTSPT